jgi:transcriptional regulator with XRE-family HTH domain
MSGALARKLGALRSRGAMGEDDVARALGTEPSVVSQWEAGELFPEAETEKALVELEYIVDLLADFYRPDEARRWLFAPQKLLSGAVPVDLIRQGQIDDVLKLAGQLRESVYF